MLALRWHTRMDLRLDIVDRPVVTRSNDVLLAVEACGICGTDIEEWCEGPIAIPAARVRGGAAQPLILGHEFCGRVIDAGSEARFEVGELVAVEVNIPCGECPACHDDRTNNCPFTVALGLQDDGGLAEYVVAPASSCVAVDGSVDPRVLAFAEPLAVGVHALSRVTLRESDDVAVFGAGAVGVLLALLLRRRGNRVVVVESSMKRRDLARQLGFEVTDPQLSELDVSSRSRFDVCFEATGNPHAVKAAINVTREGGKVVLLGIGTRDLGLSAWNLVEGEISLIASKSHTMKDFAQAVDNLVSGAIDVTSLPLGEFRLEDAVVAFEGARSHPDAYLKRMMVSPSVAQRDE